MEQEVLGCATKAKPRRVSEAERQAAIRQIMEYPLTQVRYRLETENVIPSEQLDEAILEWRKFMATILFTRGSVGMISPVIDEVWHAFILFTPDYNRFCKEIYGTFINHIPNWPGAPLSRGGGERFKQTYQELFGELPAIWTAHKSRRHHIELNLEMETDCDDCGPGKCGVSCKDCNGGTDDDCQSQ